MPISLGRMRFQVTIEELTETQDSSGRLQESWSALTWGGVMRASIEPLSGRELIAAQSIQSDIATRIQTHFHSGITSKMRVVHRGTYYNIRSAIPDDRSGNRRLTLLCTSGTNEG